MTWFKVDDKLSFHAKVVRAGNPAMGAWVRIGAWCAERESDGIIPIEVAGLMASIEELARLTEVGFLSKHPGGYELHDFLKYNPSHAELEAKRTQWVEKRHNRASRGASPIASPGASTGDARERPGSGTGSGSSDPETESPERDCHRASSARLKSVPPPPPESVEPEEPAKPESGYDLAKRVFAEEWQAKYREPYNFDFVDAGPESENRVLQGLGGKAKERGEEAERWLRHVVKTYLRDHGHRDFLVGARHAAKYIRKSWQSYGNPPTAKPRVAPVRPAEPVAPALSAAELAAKLGSMGIGKIGAVR